MRLRGAFPSNWLNAADFRGKPGQTRVVVRIEDITEETVGDKTKLTAGIRNKRTGKVFDKRWVINWTNLCILMLDGFNIDMTDPSEDPDSDILIGMEVELFTQPTRTPSGVKPGITCAVVNSPQQAKTAAKPAPAPVEVDDEGFGPPPGDPADFEL